MPGKFEIANDVVIQSGFRNPEFKDLPADQSAAPTSASDGQALPDSTVAGVWAKATTGDSFRVDLYGLVEDLDEWSYLGYLYVNDAGAARPISLAGAYTRVAAQIASGEQANVDYLKLGYPVDE